MKQDKAGYLLIKWQPASQELHWIPEDGEAMLLCFYEIVCFFFF